MYPANGSYNPNNPYNPYNSYNSYGAYQPWKSAEQAKINAEPAPDMRAVRGFWSGRFGVILASVAAAVTVAAVALAVLAPVQASKQPGVAPPAGFTQVYDNGLSDDGSWADTGPCMLTSRGLDVSGGVEGVACAFRPTANSDLTSQGFWLRVTVAPAAPLQNPEVPVILVGTDEPVIFDAQGAYFIFCHNDNTPCAQGTTTAWHTNPYVANTITVSYDAGSTTLAVFVNDQLVASVPQTQGNQPALALGADASGEALFTHVSFYSASGSAHGR